MRRRGSLWLAICGCSWMAVGAAYALPIHPLDIAVEEVAGMAAMGPEFVAKDAWVSDPTGNGDRVANPGEHVTVRIRLRNAGLADATDVRVALTTDDATVSTAGASASIANWPVGETNIAGLSIEIAPDASSHDITAIVTITAANGGPWHFMLVFPIDAPEMEFTKLDAWVDDPAPAGNVDGVANPGESVRVGIRLRNEGPSDATGVRLSLSVLDPDVTALVAEAIHTDWPAGEGRDTEFVLDISEAAQTRDVPVFVTAQADGAGPWQFSVVMPIAGPEPDFSLRSFWTFDPTPTANGDGRVVPGERVFPRIRLRNDGDGDGRDVRVSLSTLDADVTVVSGEATHGTWPAGAARNNEALVLDIAPDAQPHDAALVVDVVDADGSAWRFDVTLPIVAPAVEFAQRNFWLFDPEPGGDRDGAANPGERVFPRARLQNAGLDIAHDVRVALSTLDPDVTVASSNVSHATWAPRAARNNVGLALDIALDATPHDVTIQVAVTAARGNSSIRSPSNTGRWSSRFGTPGYSTLSPAAIVTVRPRPESACCQGSDCAMSGRPRRRT